MNILALDVATETGWAILEEGRKLSGVQKFQLNRGESPGMRLLRFRGWLKNFPCLIPHVIVYEQAHHRGGHATALINKMIGEVEAFAAEVEAEVLPVHSGTLKKFATGKGNAKKPEMIEAARERGWNPEDDNEADAALLLEYAIKECGESIDRYY